MNESVIHELIHEINGYKIMLDFDLASCSLLPKGRQSFPRGNVIIPVSDGSLRVRNNSLLAGEAFGPLGEV